MLVITALRENFNSDNYIQSDNLYIVTIQVSYVKYIYTFF